MNALMFYYSNFGNTKMTAHAIADMLESEGTVRVISVDQLSAAHFNEVDLVVMSVRRTA